MTTMRTDGERLEQIRTARDAYSNAPAGTQAALMLFQLLGTVDDVLGRPAPEEKPDLYRWTNHSNGAWVDTEEMLKELIEDGVLVPVKPGGAS